MSIIFEAPHVIRMGSQDEEPMAERMGRPGEEMAVLYSDHEKNRCQTDPASVRLAEALFLLHLVSVWHLQATKQEKGVGVGAQHQGCESCF